MFNDPSKPLLSEQPKPGYDGNQAQPKSTSCNCRAVSCYACAGISEGIGATLLFATLKVFPASAAATGIGCSALWICSGILTAASKTFFCDETEKLVQRTSTEPAPTLPPIFSTLYVPPRTRTKEPEPSKMACDQ